MLTRIHTRLAILRNEKGASAVEYGLLVSLIAAVIVGTVFILGGTLDGIFTTVNDEISAP